MAHNGPLDGKIEEVQVDKTRVNAIRRIKGTETGSDFVGAAVPWLHEGHGGPRRASVVLKKKL